MSDNLIGKVYKRYVDESGRCHREMILGYYSDKFKPVEIAADVFNAIDATQAVSGGVVHRRDGDVVSAFEYSIKDPDNTQFNYIVRIEYFRVRTEL